MEKENKQETNKKESFKFVNVPDKVIDFIFSDDERKWLIPIVLLGLILRIIVMHNIGPLADEMVHGVHAINIISSGVINTQNEAPLWFYLTDLAYKILGVNAIAARALSIFFGVLSIIALYLVASLLFNRRVGLIASFLLAISAFHIRFNTITMDGSMMFFVLAGIYFFLKEFKKTERISYFLPIFFGVAFLIKPIVAVFGAGIILYFFLVLILKQKEGKILLKNNLKRIILSSLIIFLFLTPIIAYNLSLYQQKGIADVLFARFLNISREVYSGLQGYDQSWNFSDAMSFFPKSLDYFLKLDPVIFILGVVGIALTFLFKEYKNGRVFSFFYLLPFLFLLGSGQNQIHFVSFMTLFALTSAVSLDFVIKKFNISKNKTLLIILVIIFIFELFLLSHYFFSRSAVWQARSYISTNTLPQDIIIADARIYRGRIAWMLNDRAYIESSYAGQIFQINNNFENRNIPANVYFLECVPDDCGWGTIKDQPDFNNSVENLFQQVKNSASLEKTFYGGGGYGESKEPYFKLYKSQIMVNSQLYNSIYSTHDWFYYPVRWAKKDWYDKYSPITPLQVILNSFGKIMLWIAVILSILLPIIVVKEVFNKK